MSDSFEYESISDWEFSEPLPIGVEPYNGENVPEQVLDMRIEPGRMVFEDQYAHHQAIAFCVSCINAFRQQGDRYNEAIAREMYKACLNALVRK